MFRKLALFLLFSTQLLAAEPDQAAVLRNHFCSEDNKYYLQTDKNICFLVVSDAWKCQDWLPGDPLKIERLRSYQSFSFKITNLENKSFVYAKYAFLAEDDRVIKKIEDLEHRLSTLEKWKEQF